MSNQKYLLVTFIPALIVGASILPVLDLISAKRLGYKHSMQLIEDCERSLPREQQCWLNFSDAFYIVEVD